MWKLYQFWLAVGLFLLSLLLGWGLPMIIPSTFDNGILITTVGVLVSSPFFIWAYILYRHQRSKKNTQSPKPTLFIRSSGFSRLAKDLTQQYQRYLVWYEVAISNPSSNIPLGVQRIVLTWEKARDERQINAFTPVVGDIDIREDEIEPSIKGEVSSSFNLKPNEVKAGKLVFLADENRFMAIGEYDTEILKITDNHKETFTYKAKVNDILS